MHAPSLFDHLPRERTIQSIGPGAFILRAYAHGQEEALLQEVAAITAAAPYRHLITPGGYRMSVAMTNCGEVGWMSDLTGYRYDATDPLSRRHWPHMPDVFRDLALYAAAEAGYTAFRPDACLINRYEPGARLSLHRDYDEDDAAAPIVSVSIGVPATFLWGGVRRTDKTTKTRLESGDVVVWGGASRFFYHGVATLRETVHPLTGTMRINLTFRKAR
jgi:DNA oxidative demethylase